MKENPENKTRKDREKKEFFGKKENLFILDTILKKSSTDQF